MRSSWQRDGEVVPHGFGLGRLRGVNSLVLADSPPTPLVRINLNTVLADVKAFALVSEE